MKKTVSLIAVALLWVTNVMAQQKPCLPDSLQYTIYAEKIEGKDTVFREPTELYGLFDFEKYHYRNCLTPHTISKLRQLLRGEIDYFPQEIRSNRDGILSGTDAQRRTQKIKSKFPKDSLTNEMALDTIIFRENYENIIKDISHSLSLSKERLILKIGKIYLKEMIPDLEWALTQDSTIFPPLQVKLALARLGVKKHHDFFMELFKDFSTVNYDRTSLNDIDHKRRFLPYINTPESWNLYLKENLSPNVIRQYPSDGSIVYEKVIFYHPKYEQVRKKEFGDFERNETIEFVTCCLYVDSLEEAEKKKESIKHYGRFFYDIQKKHIKDFVMPYDYEGR